MYHDGVQSLVSLLDEDECRQVSHHGWRCVFSFATLDIHHVNSSTSIYLYDIFANRRIELMEFYSFWVSLSNNPNNRYQLCANDNLNDYSKCRNGKHAYVHCFAMVIHQNQFYRFYQ